MHPTINHRLTIYMLQSNLHEGHEDEVPSKYVMGKSFHIIHSKEF